MTATVGFVSSPACCHEPCAGGGLDEAFRAELFSTTVCPDITVRHLTHIRKAPT
jgi:hypothetical protein